MSPGCNGFNRLQRCYEPRNVVIDAFFDLADASVTVPHLIRRAWTTAGTPDPHDHHETPPICATS
jgi:hypothetical protein